MLHLQEADGVELSTGAADTRQSAPVRHMESLAASTDQQPLPQSGHSAMMPAESDNPASAPATHKVTPTAASLPSNSVNLSTPATHKVLPTAASLPSNSVNLNALMEDLDRNLTQQGVSTVPKGHCSACSKPIIGQVICSLLFDFYVPTYSLG